MQDDIKEMRSDIKEIKEHVTGMLSQLSINNHILAEHERRSTNLETRIVPIEDSHKFISRLVTIFVTLASLIGFTTLADIVKRMTH